MYFIGVDVSKAKLDICVLNQDKEVCLEKCIVNRKARVLTALAALRRKLCKDETQLLICCENTGIYCRPLELACEELGVDLWVENPTKIKLASTDFRGKTDKKDAWRIANYAVRYQDRVRLYQPLSCSTRKLKNLLHAREDLLKNLQGFNARLNEARTHDPERYALLKECFGSIIRELNKKIKCIDQTMEQLAKQDQQISTNLNLLQTVPGVGRVNALNMIVYTDNFKSFQSAKHLACYAGVVPFPNQSGAVTKRDRVSRHANQILKKLLHLAAMAAIRSNSDLKQYYIRKVKEGKNKMLVINAVRNKIVHRMFVVINQQRPYQPFLLSTQENPCMLT